MAITDFNLYSISDTVIQELYKAEVRKTSTLGILTTANEPIIAAIKDSGKTLLGETKKQTDAIISMNTSTSIMAEMMSVQNDLLYDFTNTAPKVSDTTAQVLLKIEAGNNATYLAEELGVLTQNEKDFLLVVNHFDRLGDIMKEKFSSVGTSLKPLQDMTEQANKLNKDDTTAESMQSKGCLRQQVWQSSH